MFWLFDAIIALVIAGIPLFIFWRWRTKRKPLGPLYAALAVAWSIVFYGSFIEPRMLVVREYPIDLGKGGGELNIALISDTHLGPYKGAAWAEKLAKRIDALDPDVVVIVGDLASTLSGTRMFGPFKELAMNHRVYAVLGNWDYRAGAVDVRRAIESAGVEVLTNESVLIEDNNFRKIRLIGLDDLQFGSPDWDKAMAGVEPGAIKLLAVHEPDAVSKAEAEGIDLVMSGHTHGGQIRLPFIGPMLPPFIEMSSLGRKYDKGLFPWGKTQLFITSGVGESGPRARLFDPPEISLLKIKL